MRAVTPECPPLFQEIRLLFDLGLWAEKAFGQFLFETGYAKQVHIDRERSREAENESQTAVVRMGADTRRALIDVWSAARERLCTDVCTDAAGGAPATGRRGP